MTTLLDQEARARIAGDLDTTLVVEAAAGTGKTTALVGRIVSVVAAGHRGATLGRLISVTFTEKAAGEMKLRLRAALEDARAREQAGTEAHARLLNALAELEVARIGTIHALCADLLREHPLEAGVDPLFAVSKEPESRALLDTAFERWFPAALRAPPEGVRRLLRRRARRRDQLPPREQLRFAAWQLVEHRDFDGAWRRDPFDREAELDGLVPLLRELGALADQGEEGDYLQKNLLEIRRFVEELDHHEAVAPRDHDGLEASLSDLRRLRSWKYTGGRRPYSPALSRQDVVAQRDAAKVQLEQVLARSDADLAACLHAELLPVVEEYERVKARTGKLDFFDLLLRVRQLLTNDPAVRAALQARFTHLFVDEFQDTDPLQADILRLLAAEDPAATDPEQAAPVPGKLFIVGDPKQSIYRFRRADVALYEHVKRGLLAGGAALLDLTTSFRAAPALQQAINAAFSAKMGAGSLTQARYVPLNRFREGIPGQPSLVALPVPRPYSPWGKITHYAIEDSCPDAVGAFIEFLVRKSGWKVYEPGSDEQVPLQPQHICILFKRFKGGDSGDVSQRYTAALEARRIPHVLVGGRSFHAREEVLAVRNALTALEWPDDELSVYATLRGPLFALPDDALLTFRSAVGKLHPLKPLRAEALAASSQDVAQALGVLKQLHGGRNRRPIADTIAQLLEATRAHAGLAFWTAGDQALANLTQLMDLARRFEAAGGRSFRAFLHLLQRQAEGGEVPEAPIVEEGSEGVRMMTVHGAKGLEFPVVILAEPTAPHRRQHPSHWVEPAARLWAEPLAGCKPVELSEHGEEVLRRDDEESIRLGYVAATRARDLLVVPVVGDERAEGWVDVLHPVLYPRPDAARTPRPAPGCPPFSGESVLERPESAWAASSLAAPGLHRAELGEHDVVWWDPKALELEKVHPPGLHQDELLRDDEGGVRSAEALAAYEAWRAAREDTLVRGGTPGEQVSAAHEAAPSPAVAGPPVDAQTTDADRAHRPAGRRFGTLVHAALAELPLRATDAQVHQGVRMSARALGSAEEEISAAVDAVAAALRHPLLRRAAVSPRVCREMPVTLRREDGALVEGVVDLAFVEDGTWCVVDFKTDAELEERRAAHEAQVSLYVEAIALATGQPARGILLRV